jgi:hypothetical protein
MKIRENIAMRFKLESVFSEGGGRYNFHPDGQITKLKDIFLAQCVSKFSWFISSILDHAPAIHVIPQILTSIYATRQIILRDCLIPKDCQEGLSNKLCLRRFLKYNIPCVPVFVSCQLLFFLTSSI